MPSSEIDYPVSVVITTYDETRLSSLRSCVAAAQRQLRTGDELFVVVDHNEQLRTALSESMPGVQVLSNVLERGCAATRNRGAQVASGEVVVFLDDDMLPQPEFLSRVLEPFNDPSVVATGGRAIARWSDGRPSWFPPEFDWTVGCAYVGMALKSTRVRNLWGPIALRRWLFDELQGFDETMGRVGNLPLGCEDTDLAIRAQTMYPQATLLYVADATVLHEVPAGRATPRYFFRRCYAEGLSKAMLTWRVGAVRGLSLERQYARKVLPRAVIRDLARGVYGHPTAFLRAAITFLGFSVTVVGFLRGRYVRWLPRNARSQIRGLRTGTAPA